MSPVFSSQKTRRIRAAALSLTASVLFAASGLPALAQADKSAPKSVQPRAFRALAEVHADRCLPANGAQIMGGFAGPDDRLDPVTGEICTK
jgi:hypothetical protein